MCYMPSSPDNSQFHLICQDFQIVKSAIPCAAGWLSSVQRANSTAIKPSNCPDVDGVGEYNTCNMFKLWQHKDSL